MLAIPRLPAVIAARCPGLTLFSGDNLFSSETTAPVMSLITGRSKTCRMRNNLGNCMGHLLM